MVDVQRRQRRCMSLNRLIRRQQSGVNDARLIAGLPTRQAQPTQSSDRGRRPSRAPRPLRRLKQDRPEHRPQTGDVKRPRSGDAGVEASRQRIATVQQTVYAVSRNTDVAAQCVGVQRRIDDGLIEARQGVAKVGVGRFVKKGGIEKARGGGENSGEARSKAGQFAQLGRAEEVRRRYRYLTGAKGANSAGKPSSYDFAPS